MPHVREPRLAVLSPEQRAALETEADQQAARWAPVFYQHTSSRHPERDRPLRVDFDGDWDATNNWENLTPAVGAQQPAVYASAILTDTHAYLTYTLFYPRDWIPVVCVRYACHDNDLEVVLLVTERGKAPRDPGALIYAESKFHSKYVAERGDQIARARDGRPVMQVESEGHGVTPAHVSDALELDDVVIFREARSDREPVAARSESYELLPLSETLWQRRRPLAMEGRLWTGGDLGFLAYRGARFGELGRPLGATMANREFVGGVRPPWGIDPERNRGDWFFDPAFGALKRHPGFFGRGEASLDYELNPYVEDLASECRGARCLPLRAEAAPAPVPAMFPLATVGLLLLGSRRRPRARVATAARAKVCGSGVIARS
jgi:hypothetical protein